MQAVLQDPEGRRHCDHQPRQEGPRPLVPAVQEQHYEYLIYNNIEQFKITKNKDFNIT